MKIKSATNFHGLPRMEMKVGARSSVPLQGDYIICVKLMSSGARTHYERNN